MIDDKDTPSRTHRVRWPVVAALTAVAAGALAFTFAVAGGLPGSSSGAPVFPAASAAPAVGQGGGMVDAGWVAPAAQPGTNAPANGNSPGRASKLGHISITRIDGSRLALVTDDGWTRTIDAAGATITRDGAKIAVADLAVGDEIVLRQKRQADGTFTVTAIQVILPKVSGLVTDVAASSLTLAARDGTKTTVKLTASTTYRLGKDAADKSVVKAGMQAVATGPKAADGTLTATSITVSPSQVAGTVSAVAATSLTLAARDGTKTTVKLTSSTTYRLGKNKADLSVVKVGMQAVATGLKAEDGTLTATSVTVAASRIAGTVSATSPSTITLTDRKGSKTTLKVTSSTTFWVAGVAAPKLADVKVGMWIAAEGVRNDDGSFAASAVRAAAAGKAGGWGDWKPNPGKDGGPKGATPAPASSLPPSSNG